MMSLWDALRMNMMISYQELVRTFPNRRQGGVYVPLAERAGEIVQASFVDVPWKVLCSGITGRSHLYESEYAESS
ncbi:hypothetical protein B9075_013400 [Klebsiella pneumoniae]|nr:hypothetical protein B9075_013400 [Klebsiella pneumoniae]